MLRLLFSPTVPPRAIRVTVSRSPMIVEPALTGCALDLEAGADDHAKWGTDVIHAAEMPFSATSESTDRVASRVNGLR